MAASGKGPAGTDGQIERAVCSEDVRAIGSQQRVIRSLVPRICKCAAAERVYTQVLTPGIRRLEIEAADILEVCQCLQRVIVGMTAVGIQRRGAELRIGEDQILRES